MNKVCTLCGAEGHTAPNCPWNGQSKRSSFVEAVVNTLVGLVIAMLATAVICWAYDIPMLWENNFKITAWMTALSVARSYVIRRYFNKKDSSCSTS